MCHWFLLVSLCLICTKVIKYSVPAACCLYIAPFHLSLLLLIRFVCMYEFMHLISNEIFRNDEVVCKLKPFYLSFAFSLTLSASIDVLPSAAVCLRGKIFRFDAWICFIVQCILVKWLVWWCVHSCNKMHQE